MVNHKWALVQGQAERRALRRLLELMNEHDVSNLTIDPSMA